MISRAIERILEEGAEDAYATFYLGKKSRPGFNLKIVCKNKFANKLANVAIEETGTLGVKTYEQRRLMVPRVIRSVPVKFEDFEGIVPVKVSILNGKIIRTKPEFENAKDLAIKLNVPLRLVLEAITRQAEVFFSKDGISPKNNRVAISRKRVGSTR